MVDVVIIDDLPEAYRLAIRLQDEFDHHLNIDLIYSQTIVGNRGLPVTGATNTIGYDKVSSYLSSEHAPEDLILILDLGLNLPDIRSQLKEKYSILTTVPDVQIEGLGLALDASFNPAIKRLMVYFSTSQGNNSDAFDLLSKEIAKLSKKNAVFRTLELFSRTGHAFVHINESTKEAREKKARKILIDVTAKWESFFIETSKRERELQREIKRNQDHKKQNTGERVNRYRIPNLLIGIGLPPDAYKQYCEQHEYIYREKWKGKYVRFRKYLKDIRSDPNSSNKFKESELTPRIVEREAKKLLEAAYEIKILVELPETGKVVDLGLKLKQNTHLSIVLKHWAIQSEMQKESNNKKLEFSDKDFKPRRKSTQQAQSVGDYDQAIAKEVIRSGGHIEKIPSQQHAALKTAICHIRKALTSALKEYGFVLDQKIIRDGSDGKYSPAFGCGIYIYFSTRREKRRGRQ